LTLHEGKSEVRWPDERAYYDGNCIRLGHGTDLIMSDSTGSRQGWQSYQIQGNICNCLYSTNNNIIPVTKCLITCDVTKHSSVFASKKCQHAKRVGQKISSHDLKFRTLGT
jgi:hypothetical protein